MTGNAKSDRDKRLGDALRENLKRRRAQAKGRAVASRDTVDHPVASNERNETPQSAPKSDREPKA